MAENRVEIVVTSRNDTKAGFDSAKLDAEKAGDEAGNSFMSKFSGWLSGGAGAGGGAGSGVGGVLSSAFSSGPVGIGAITAAVVALLPELDGLLSGFAAAAAGAGAFYLLGHNTIQQLTQDYGALQTAQEAVQKAQDKYTLDPTKANLTALNTAQLNLAAVRQGAQQDLGSAAPAVDKFATALGNLQQKFQPVLFEVISDAFGAMNNFLPTLVPLANAFADAIGPLFVKLGQFAQSKGFQGWFRQLLADVGPATTAIGTGIGQVVTQFGKLLTVLPPGDVVTTIGLAFGFLSGAIDTLRLSIEAIMKPITLFADIVTFLNGTSGNLQTLGASSASVRSVAGANFSGLSALGGKLPVLGHPAAAVPMSGMKRRAAGGPAGGWTIVGEQGPELVDLPGGSYVHPAGSFGRGGGGAQVVFSGGAAMQLEQFIKMLWPGMQLEVRNRGGGGKNSVQVALGQSH